MRLEPRAWSVGANMSVRRHIGNPEVRARSGSENRRGRAYRKRLHVGREYVDFRPPEGGKRRREEGSGGGREGEGGGGRRGGPGGLRARAAWPPSRTGLLYLSLKGAKCMKTQVPSLKGLTV